MNTELLQICIWLFSLLVALHAWLFSLLVALYAIISLAEWAFGWLTRD